MDQYGTPFDRTRCLRRIDTADDCLADRLLQRLAGADMGFSSELRSVPESKPDRRSACDLVSGCRGVSRGRFSATPTAVRRILDSRTRAVSLGSHCKLFT